MSRLQILARDGDIKVLVDGREVERVESFVIGAGADEAEPLACLYMAPESIEFDGLEFPMMIKELSDAEEDDSDLVVMQAASVPLNRPAAEAAILTGYGQGKLRINSVVSQDGVRWIAAAREQSLVEFLRDARVPLAVIALALAELTEERA